MTVSPDIEDEAGIDENEELAETHAADIRVPLATRNALEGAMKHSIRLAQRSYRVAVPQYHWGKIQLSLPLYLRDSSRPDLALTLDDTALGIGRQQSSIQIGHFVMLVYCLDLTANGLEGFVQI